MTSVMIRKCSFYDQARAAFVYFWPWSKCKKGYADRTRIFGPAQRRAPSHYIAMTSTHTQDAQGKALSLQDVIFVVSSMD